MGSLLNDVEDFLSQSRIGDGPSLKIMSRCSFWEKVKRKLTSRSILFFSHFDGVDFLEGESLCIGIDMRKIKLSGFLALARPGAFRE